MATGRKQLVEVTYRDVRPGDSGGNLMRRKVLSTRPLSGGRVELRMEWLGTGKPDRATPQANRKVKVERVIEALRHRAKARTTGGVVEVWDTKHPESEIEDYEVDGHKWALRCEHGTVVGRRTEKEAMADVRDPRLWCTECVVPAGAQMALL